MGSKKLFYRNDGITLAVVESIHDLRLLQLIRDSIISQFVDNPSVDSLPEIIQN